MSTVYVAEKPSVAREIAGVVGADCKRDGYLETGDGQRVVTWAFGHLVRYANPDEYGAAWSGDWCFEQLPMIPEEWRLVVDKSAARQFETVKGLMNRAERVVCATDAGREGERIFRLIYERAGCRVPVQRLWVSSLTYEALSVGLDNLYPWRAFDDLAAAACVRAQADWLVGFNLTRAYTARHGTLCSVGRVQTPTLAMVVRRDEAIETFTPVAYYEVVAHLAPGFDAVFARLGGEDDKGGRTWERRIEVRDVAKGILKGAWSRAAVVDEVETRTVSHRAPPLFDLTSLQREANRRLGWTAAQTLEAAQGLYDAKLLTYPRTESRHLSEDMRPLLPELLRGLDHLGAATALDYLKNGAGMVPGKAYIDDAKLTDHHAVIPTRERWPGNWKRGAVWWGLYCMVVGRFVSIFYPDHVVDETWVRLDVSGYSFVGSGRREVERGWREVLGGGEEGEGGWLPALTKGEQVVVDSLEVKDKETVGPRRYDDASLLSAMKNAGRMVGSEGQAEVLKESGGLGTPATRAAIIEGLLKRGYLERDRKALVSTEKGRALVDVVAEPMRSPELTATWEEQLKAIEGGKGSAAGFLDAIGCFVREAVPKVKDSEGEVPGGERESESFGACPVCGGDVVERVKSFGCSAWRTTGCQFAVWKVMAKKKLPVAQVRNLLNTGVTSKMKGFKNREGKPFDARLRIGPNGKVRYQYGDEE